MIRGPFVKTNRLHELGVDSIGRRRVIDKETVELHPGQLVFLVAEIGKGQVILSRIYYRLAGMVIHYKLESLDCLCVFPPVVQVHAGIEKLPGRSIGH